MQPRERVLNTFRFGPVDRVAFDIMESSIWPELLEYFRQTRGITEPDQVLDYLDTDFRWVGSRYVGPEDEAACNPEAQQDHKLFSKDVRSGPLAGARTIAEIEHGDWQDPAWWVPGNYAAAREKWPDHALVCGGLWITMFWGACEAFGMEEALVKMHAEPALFDAFVRQRHEFYMDYLTRVLPEAEGHCDICWLGDDYATQRSLLMSPELWRKMIKPYLAEQAQLIRSHGMHILFHSCGSVRPILPDFVDIGIDALLVFQTTAEGMDPRSIARDFGGRLVFYGGIDIQQLLSYGTPAEVEETVRANVEAFADCGGYIVANSHHGVTTIKGENIEAMCRTAGNCTAPFGNPR
jgi:uroporphyrinogen decarboxylase